jgi:predicted NBD/HSP70 family sugar kinase
VHRDIRAAHRAQPTIGQLPRHRWGQAVGHPAQAGTRVLLASKCPRLAVPPGPPHPEPVHRSVTGHGKRQRSAHSRPTHATQHVGEYDNALNQRCGSARPQRLSCVRSRLELTCEVRHGPESADRQIGANVTRARTINVRDLRKRNRARALATIYHNGPMTRQEIGEATGVSPATVSNLVGDLLEQGVIVEAGAEDSDGGRPRALLRVKPEYWYVVGVDVGETAILVELFDLDMQVRASHSITPIAERLDPEKTAEYVLEGLDRVITYSGVAKEAILGVGVGVPGLVEHGDDAIIHGENAVVHAQTIGWDGVPFGKMLRRGTALPLFVENGAKTFGQAEKWFGAARDAENTIIVLLGTGTGVSIFTEGQLYRGASSSAGEWGHTTVMVDGRTCRCGAKGCLEAYVGGRAIVARYDELCKRTPADSDPDLVARLTAIAEATGSDSSAAKVLQETATYLGVGIANLINLFNPEQIVIGGWIDQILEDKILPTIREVASRQALRMPFGAVSIIPARLGRDAVALGAATLPVDDFLAAGAVPSPGPTTRRAIRPILALGNRD